MAGAAGGAALPAVAPVAGGAEGGCCWGTPVVCGWEAPGTVVAGGGGTGVEVAPVVE